MRSVNDISLYYWSLAVYLTVAVVSLPVGALYALGPNVFRHEETPAP